MNNNQSERECRSWEIAQNICIQFEILLKTPTLQSMHPQLQEKGQEMLEELRVFQALIDHEHQNKNNLLNQQ